jgi:hypothetical protein
MQLPRKSTSEARPVASNSECGCESGGCVVWVGQDISNDSTRLQLHLNRIYTVPTSEAERVDSRLHSHRPHSHSPSTPQHHNNDLVLIDCVRGRMRFPKACAHVHLVGLIRYSLSFYLLTGTTLHS